MELIEQHVPNVDSLIKSAPEAGGAMGGITSAFGGGGKLGSLAGLAGGFSKLGLGTGMAGKFIPIILSFVQNRGGESVKQMLEKVMK